MKKPQSQISYNMSKVKSAGSQIEKLIATELRRQKIKFRRQQRQIEGNPDFVIAKQKVVIFCDSHFWHGYDWNKRKADHKSNKEYWFNKIKRNIERDRTVNKILKAQGWKVFRFWEHEILKSSKKCINRVNAGLKHNESL